MEIEYRNCHSQEVDHLQMDMHWQTPANATSGSRHILETYMEGLQVETMESVIGEADIFTAAAANTDIITLAHMKKMENNAIVGNSGYFENEIDMECLEKVFGIKV